MTEKFDHFEEFLKTTEYCDFDNPEIQKLSNSIISKDKSQKENAIRLFYWVRDNILYRVGLWHRKASETLIEGEGTCTNSANLLVALFRINKIPSGYGVMKVHGQRYFGPVALPWLRKFAREVSTHVYVVVYLNNKWIKCDPSDDSYLCLNTHHFNYTTKIVEWDGENHAPLNLKDEYIIKDTFPIASIDPWMKKNPNTKKIAITVANLYIKFLRNSKVIADNQEQVELLFRGWLNKNHPFYYFQFVIVSFLEDIKLKIKKYEKNSKK